MMASPSSRPVNAWDALPRGVLPFGDHDCLVVIDLEVTLHPLSSIVCGVETIITGPVTQCKQDHKDSFKDPFRSTVDYRDSPESVSTGVSEGIICPDLYRFLNTKLPSGPHPHWAVSIGVAAQLAPHDG